MNKLFAVGIGLLLLFLLLLFSSTYTVKYNEAAIKATFGQTSEHSVVREPGLKFRLPVFIDKVTRLDTRLQLVESPGEEILTQDGLQIVVSGFMLWRVQTEGSGPLDFFEAYRTIGDATDQLKSPFKTEFANELSKYRFDELIGEGSRLDEAEIAVRQTLTGSFASQGVEPVVIGISQITLPPGTSRAVLNRMQSTRQALAEAERAAGENDAQAIQSAANTKVGKIRSFANQRAEEIRAIGEQQAEKYLKQMSVEEDLAIFLVWLDTLDRSLSKNTMLVLSADFQPFHLFNRAAKTRNGIPQPPRLLEVPVIEEDPAPDTADEEG